MPDRISALSDFINKKNIYEIFVYLIIITLPFTISYNSIAIIGLGVVWILSGNFLQKKKLLFANPLGLAMITLFALHVLGLLISSDKADASMEIEKKLCLLFFPLLLQTKPVCSHKAYNISLFVFIGTCVFTSILCLTSATYNYSLNHDHSVFFHHALVKTIDFHAIYFSYYIVLALMILTQTFIFEQKFKQYLKLYWITTTFLIIMLFLLASKTVIALFLLLSFIIIIYYNRLKNKTFKGVLLATSITIGVLTIAMILPATRERILNTKFKSFEGEQDYGNGLAARIEFSRYALRLISPSNVILGVGTGDLHQKLIEEYNKDHFILPYMPHNQYITIFVSMGLVGLLSFLAVLGIALKMAYQQKHTVAFIFTIFMMVCFLTESALQVQKGIVFFFLFISLFLFHAPTAPNKEINQEHL